ncbi:UNVERIFIED_CONTAM: hypothetical protein FKN15_017231 [Acipenser sinensis]
MTSRTPRKADATPSAGTKGESPEIKNEKESTRTQGSHKTPPISQRCLATSRNSTS